MKFSWTCLEHRSSSHLFQNQRQEIGGNRLINGGDGGRGGQWRKAHTATEPWAVPRHQGLCGSYLPLSKTQIIKRPIRSIYAAALGFVGSRFSLSALKPNLALSSCTNRAVCALSRMCVSNAPRAIPNISTPSNNRTSGAELTIDTV